MDVWKRAAIGSPKSSERSRTRSSGEDSAASAGSNAAVWTGRRAELTVLAGPIRNLHTLQATPSMMRALRGADLVVAIGAELEIGWLPVAIGNAANPKLRPGGDGYFEAADQVPLLDAGMAANRALGDVHPLGNPHVNMDPVRMARIDPAGAAGYRRAARTFAAKVDRRMKTWRPRLAAAPGVVLYHRDAIYLLKRFGVPLLGTIEPVPGIPPTGRHISRLTAKLKGRKGVIIYAPYQSAKAPRSLAGKLGWPVRRLPLEPPKSADGNGYLRHIAKWVDALAIAK